MDSSSYLEKDPLPDASESFLRFLRQVRRHTPSVLCALAGFLSAFTVSLVGLLPLGELILFVTFPVVVTQSLMQRHWPTRVHQLGWYRLMLILVGLMFIGYVASDLYRSTSGSNLARGWARVAFLAIDLVSIPYLINASWRRFFIFVVSLFCGYALNAALTGPLYGEWWKFGVGYTLTVLVLFFCGGRSRVLQIVVTIALGILSLWLGSRSLGALCVLAASFYGLSFARGIWKPVALLGASVAFGGLFFAAVQTVAGNEEHANSNIERQSMIETAADAFIGSPLIGQGSWFTASRMLSRLEEQRAALDPGFRGYSEEEARLLSIHSQILVSLAEGGVFGGLFFLVLGLLLLQTLNLLMRVSVPHRMLILYLVLTAAWDLLMSPFSGVARVQIVLAITICLLVILQRRGELPEVEND